MTPEQLEELPGVGPKTVEKISVAVNNYFSSLETSAPLEGEAAATADSVEAESQAEAEGANPAAQDEKPADAEAGETGQALEVEAGTENAAPVETAEVEVHSENGVTRDEVVEPEEPKPGQTPGE